MAGDWIKIENTTPDKPEVFIIADELQIDPDAVVGKLIRIWIWADEQTIDGNAVIVTRSLLNRLAGVSNFADAMEKAGWLKNTDDGLVFPNFEYHNGETAKQRALTAKRVRRHRRKRNAKCNDVGVTEALTREEKRRDKEEGDSREGTVVLPQPSSPPPPMPPVPPLPDGSPAYDLTTEFLFYYRGPGKASLHDDCNRLFAELLRHGIEKRAISTEIARSDRNRSEWPSALQSRLLNETRRVKTDPGAKSKSFSDLVKEKSQKFATLPPVQPLAGEEAQHSG